MSQCRRKEKRRTTGPMPTGSENSASRISMAPPYNRRAHGHLQSLRDQPRKQSRVFKNILRQYPRNRQTIYLVPRIPLRNVAERSRVRECIHHASNPPRTTRGTSTSPATTCRRRQVVAGQEQGGIWHPGAKSIRRRNSTRMESTTRLHGQTNQGLPQRKTISTKMVTAKPTGSTSNPSSHHGKKLRHDNQAGDEGRDHQGDTQVPDLPPLFNTGSRIYGSPSNTRRKLAKEGHPSDNFTRVRIDNYPCSSTSQSQDGRPTFRRRLGRGTEQGGRGTPKEERYYRMEQGYEQEGQAGSQESGKGVGKNQREADQDYPSKSRREFNKLIKLFKQYNTFASRFSNHVSTTIPGSTIGSPSFQGPFSDGEQFEPAEELVVRPNMANSGLVEQNNQPICRTGDRRTTLPTPTPSQRIGGLQQPGEEHSDSIQLGVRGGHYRAVFHAAITNHRASETKDLGQRINDQSSNQGDERRTKEAGQIGNQDVNKEMREKKESFKLIFMCIYSMLAFFLAITSFHCSFSLASAEPTASFTHEGELFIAQKIMHVPIDIPINEYLAHCKYFYNLHFVVNNQEFNVGKERWFTLIRYLERPCQDLKLIAKQLQNDRLRGKRGIFLQGARILKTLFGKFDMFDIQGIIKLIEKIPWRHKPRTTRLQQFMKNFNHTLAKFDKKFESKRITWRWRKLFSRAMDIASRTKAITEGLRLARHGHLTSGLVNITTAKSILRVVEDHLKKERGTENDLPRLHPITASPMELYDCPVSILAQEKPCLLIHIPIVAEKFELQQFSPIPFMRHQKPTIIQPDKTLLAWNKESQTSLSAEQLSRCWTIRPKHWVCHHSLPLFTSDQEGCLSAVKASNPMSIQNRCKLREVKDVEVAQLRDSFILYSPKETVLEFRCPHQETTMEAGAKGLIQRPFKPGCKVMAKEFKLWQPEEMLLPASVVVDVKWNQSALIKTAISDTNNTGSIPQDNLLALNIMVPINTGTIIGLILIWATLHLKKKFKKKKKTPRPQPLDQLRPIPSPPPMPSRPSLSSFRPPSPRSLHLPSRSRVSPPYQRPLPHPPKLATIRTRAQVLKSSDNIYATTSPPGDPDSPPRIVI